MRSAGRGGRLCSMRGAPVLTVRPHHPLGRRASAPNPAKSGNLRTSMRILTEFPCGTLLPLGLLAKGQGGAAFWKGGNADVLSPGQRRSIDHRTPPVPSGAPAVHLPIAMSSDPDNPPVAPAVGGLDAFTSTARGIRGLRNHGNGVQR